MKDFGERLRATRIALGMTQEQLGFEIGVTKASISAWEKNRERPGFRTLPRIRAVMNTSLDELICAIDTNSAETQASAPAAQQGAKNASERALLTHFRRMPASRRRALLALIRD